MADKKVDLEYAKEYWSLANVITGFSILQMIAYVLSVGASDSKIRSGVLDLFPWVLLFIMVGAAIYGVIVFILCLWQIKILRPIARSELVVQMWIVTALRLIAIAFFSFLGCLITWMLRHSQGKISLLLLFPDDILGCCHSLIRSLTGPPVRRPRLACRSTRSIRRR